MNLFRPWLFASFLIVGVAFADDLAKEIDAWTPGKEIPHRLLSFPDGNVESQVGLSHHAVDVELALYIESIKNDALLEELVFDYRSEPASLRHAVIKLIERKGLPWFALRLSARETTRWEHDAFKQLLQSRHVKVSVATVEPKFMPRTEALVALRKLEDRLESGQSWSEAYRAVADEYPNIEERKREPRVETTLITYLFDGWLCEGGFAFSELQINPYLPQKHLKRIVASQKGVQIIEGSDQIYLYFISEIYEPGA